MHILSLFCLLVGAKASLECLILQLVLYGRSTNLEGYLQHTLSLFCLRVGHDAISLNRSVAYRRVLYALTDRERSLLQTTALVLLVSSDNGSLECFPLVARVLEQCGTLFFELGVGFSAGLFVFQLVRWRLADLSVLSWGSVA